MKAIFIYGPPAAGKLTVANELHRLIGYPVFHNHAAISILTPLFPYSDEKLNKIRSRLGRQIRLIVQLKPSHEALMKRVENESRKGQKIDDREYLKKHLESKPEIWDKYPDVEHITVDNSDMSPEEAARQIIEYYKIR